MILCWSLKGGSGTSVVAAAIALRSSVHRPTVLADLAGDSPAVLGLAEPDGPGLLDWMASPTADVAALTRLAVPATDTLHLLPRGGVTADPVHRWAELAEGLAALGTVVVDAGTGPPAPALLRAAEQSLLVTRSCYLALRRVAVAPAPTGVVLLLEPGRSLSAGEVSRVARAPVVAQVPYDPAVARAVDSGLLASRLPRSLQGALREVA